MDYCFFFEVEIFIYEEYQQREAEDAVVEPKKEEDVVRLDDLVVQWGTT